MPTLAATVLDELRPTVVKDNNFIGFGDNLAAGIGWCTDDANANYLMVDLPTGGAVDVPVMAIGEDIFRRDLALFNGVTQPMMAVVDSDRDSYIGLTFNADDQAELAIGGSAAANGLMLAVAGCPLKLQNTTDAASNEVLRLGGGNRATPADNDEVYVTFYLDDSTGTQVEFARITVIATDVTSTTQDAKFEYQVMVGDTLTTIYEMTSTAAGAITATLTAPMIYAESTNPAGTLCYVGRDNAGDLTINALVNKAINLAIAGTDEVTLTASALSPATSDGNALGTTALMWADLFLASGGVINFNNGNQTITHDNATVTLTLTGKLAFGGNTDWGTGATGTEITGAGYDWVTQTIGRVNTDINNTAAAAAYHALTVTVSQANSNSFFGTWTELYLSNSVDLTGADNVAAVWGQIEAGTNVTLSDTGCFTAGGYFNVIAGSTLTVAAGHSVNGVRVQLEVAAMTNNGTVAAFECLKKSGTVDWAYGLYVADAQVGVSLDNVTLTPDANRTYIGLSIGTRATGKDITMAASASQNLDPVQMNFNIIGSNPTSTSTVNLIYQQITHNTTAMSNLRLKGGDWTMTINKDHQDAYIYQGEIDYGADAVTVGGEVGVGCFTLAAGAGAVTGNLRGIIVNVNGAGLPATTSIGVEVRTDGGSATLGEGVRIWSVGANSISTGIKLMGTVTEGIDFSGVTYTPDVTRTNYAIGIGSRADELTVNLGNAASQNFEPFQMNINLTATAGAPTSTSTARLLRIRSTHNTTDMANLRIMNLNTYMDVRKNIQAAYGQMNSVDFQTNAVTVTTEAAVGVFNMECVSAVTGNVRGIIVNLYGANLPSTSIGIEVRSDGGAATLAEGIRIWSVGSCSLTTGLYLDGTITTDIRLSNGSTIADTSGNMTLYSASGKVIKLQAYGDTDDYITISTNNENVPTIYGTGAYLRIGDGATTSHTLASEDDLMVTGKLEVDNRAYFDHDVYLNTTLFMNTYAFDFILLANTAAALEITDGTTALLAFDTRNTVTVENFKFTQPASQTLPDGATSRLRAISQADFTVTLAGTTQITTLMDGVAMCLGAPTINQSGGAVIVDEASTLHVPLITAGANVTITANRMISTGVADCYLTVGGVWTDTVSTVKVKRNIQEFDLAATVPYLLDQIHPKMFMYNGHFGGDFDRQRYGAIAEEFPDFLKVPGDISPSGVSASILGNFALVGVKYLHEQVKEQGERLEAVEEANKILRGQLETAGLIAQA